MVKFAITPQLINTLTYRLGALTQRFDQIQAKPSFSDAQFHSLRKDTTQLQEHLAQINDAVSEQNALWADEFKPLTERATALEHQVWTGTRHPPGRMPDKDDVFQAVDRYLSAPTADGADRPKALVMPHVAQALEHVPGLEAHFTRFPERIALLSLTIALGGLISNPIDEDDYAPFYLFLLKGMLQGQFQAGELIRKNAPLTPFEKLNAAFRQYSAFYTFLGDAADRLIAFGQMRGDDHCLSRSQFTVFQGDPAIARNIFTQAVVYNMAVREAPKRHMPLDPALIEAEEGLWRILLAKSVLWAAHEGIYGPITHAAQAVQRVREPIRRYYSLFSYVDRQLAIRKDLLDRYPEEIARYFPDALGMAEQALTPFSSEDLEILRQRHLPPRDASEKPTLMIMGIGQEWYQIHRYASAGYHLVLVDPSDQVAAFMKENEANHRRLMEERGVHIEYVHTTSDDPELAARFTGRIDSIEYQHVNTMLDQTNANAIGAMLKPGGVLVYISHAGSNYIAPELQDYDTLLDAKNTPAILGTRSEKLAHPTGNQVLVLQKPAN